MGYPAAYICLAFSIAVLIGANFSSVFIKNTKCNDEMCVIKVNKGECFIEGLKPQFEGWYHTDCSFNTNLDFNTTVPCHYGDSGIPKLRCETYYTDLGSFCYISSIVNLIPLLLSLC